MFALSLSFEGIQLLHRGAGGWRLVGSVAPDADNLNDELASLRKSASRLEPGGVRSKILLPNDQIKFLTTSQPAKDDQDYDSFVRAALDGATPYDVSELVFDISHEGDKLHVAAVARETLKEAEAFAVEHNFHPICFAAVPGDEGFLGEPNFGMTKHAETVLRPNEKLDPDGVAVVVTGKADIPDGPVVQVNSDTPVAEVEDETEQSEDFQEKDVVQTARKSPPVPSESKAQAETDETAQDSKKAALASFSSIRTAKPEILKPEAGTSPLGGVQRDQDRPSAPKIPIPGATKSDPIVATREAAPLITGIPVDGLAEEDQQDLSAPTPSDTLAERSTSGGIPPAPDSPALSAELGSTASVAALDASQPEEVGGKPRFLGIILTAILLLFLAAVAAWASLFLEDGLAGLFRRDPDVPDVAVLTQDPLTDAPVIVAPAVEQSPDVALAPEAPAPDASVAPENIIELAALEADTDELSAADAAVLDALRQPVPPQEITRETTVARYAETGVWQMAPAPPEHSDLIDLDDMYVASIDPVTGMNDAVALPPSSTYLTDIAPAAIRSPAAAGTQFALDENGLVIPTPQGALNPDGVLVYLGKPPAVPPEVPTRVQPENNDEAAALARLAKLRPRLRPDDLIEQNERTQLGGLSRSELAGIRPKLRPEIEKSNQEKDETPTALAVKSSITPNARPKNMDQIVQLANVRAPERTEVPSIASVTTITPRVVAPKIPSSASVAKQATVKNAINLSRVNLIGVYGAPSSRRALVRLENGRYKKVKVGDRIDGGKISAIGDSELRYVKGGRNVVLKMPKS